MKLRNAKIFFIAGALLAGNLAVSSASDASQSDAVAGKRELSSAYENAWMTVRDNYFPKIDEQRWQDWREAFRGKLETRKQLRAAISAMLSSLHDDYSYILSASNKRDHQKLVDEKHAVKFRMLKRKVGYIKVSSFEPQTMVAQLREALSRLSKAQAYVLDLRNNHGGYIDYARQSFAMLTSQGKFMSYEGRQDGRTDEQRLSLTPAGWQVDANNSHSLKQRLPNLTEDKPLVVLVNKDTRSAAEMLAGALKENGRAFLVGSNTYGKGVLQDTYEIGEGIEIKLVTARYFLPDGDTPQQKGLVPDLEVENNPNSNEDFELKQAVQFGTWAIAQRIQGRRQSMALR